MSGLLQSEIKAPTHSIISKIFFMTLLKKGIVSYQKNIFKK